MPGTTSPSVERRQWEASRKADAADVTYPIVLRQAFLEQRGLDEGWEPLTLVPIARPISRNLSKAHDDGVHARALCDDLQDVLSDPFALGIAEWL